MAKQLTAAAIEKIRTDGKLFTDLCDMLDIRTPSLVTNLQRNSERLQRHDVVIAIAESMGADPKDILEEKPEPVSA